MKLYLLQLYFLLQCVQPVFSQEPDEKDFTLYTQQQGLSNNNVTGITQDKRGYIWLSTRNGLNRYNGNDFVQFHTNSSSNSLPVEEIYSLKWLDEYRLLALTMGGLHIINTGDGSFSNIIIPPGKLKYAFKVNNVVAVCTNRQSDIFIITKSGFYHYNKNKELVYRFDYYKEEEAETNAFVFADDMVLLDENLLLIKAIDGAYIYDATTHSIKKITRNDHPLFSEFVDVPNADYLLRQIRTGSFIVLKLNTDTAIYMDFIKQRKIINKLPIYPLYKEFLWPTELSKINDTLFYINGFANGFYKMIINETTGEIKLSTEKYFSKYNCKTVFKDHENRLWIGTDKGIFKQQSKKPVATSVEIRADILHHFPAPLFHEILVSGNKVFAASRHEGGLLVLDKNSLQLLQRISLKNSPSSSNSVLSISKFKDDTLLIGTLGPLFWLKISTLKYGEIKPENWDMKHYWVAAQFRDSRGNNWVSNNADVYQYKATDKKFTRFEKNKFLDKLLVARYIDEDRDKNIWLGGDGLCRFNISTNSFDMLIDSFPFIRFPRKEIVGLAIDKNNIMWFGNAYNGLISYDISTHAFRQFTNQDGLPDNLIKALLVVKNKLWIACPSGIACLDLITNKLAAYGKDDGFPQVPVTGNKFFYDSATNQLYIGCENYLVRFNLDSLLQQDPPPFFFIESIQFANDTTFFYPPEKIGVPYFYNNFSIRIGSINYNDVQNQRFAYRFLHNADTSWKTINGDPVINFNNLSSGTYRLQVKLYAANNRWPEQVIFFTIIITPPFWQTWWFIMLCVLLFGILIFWSVRLRIKNIRKKNNIDKQLAELEMKGLHAQMNPHFMFNALNSIKDMILHDEKNNASRYLSKFAQLIRLTLEHSQQTFITLRESIEHLEYYLEMEQLRFADLDYEIKTDPSVDVNETLLPPMLLQPLVENAVWHGLLPKQGNKKVEIKFRKQNDLLVCEVEDNGIGINTSIKNKTQNINRSFGIENIMQRMKVLNEKYKLHYLFSIKDKKEIPLSKGTGTIATLSLPLNS